MGTGKLCLISGGNSGIGKAAAVMIAKAGYTVAIGCRNERRGLAALEDIRRESGNTSAVHLKLDLSSQTSICAAADELGSRFGALDVLIHNAADFDIARKEPAYSPEGIETVWATNHVGPVLLTRLLGPLLEKSAGARVITVSSLGLMMHGSMRIRHDDPEFRTGGFSVEKAYYHSKLAQVMYTYWLSRKLRGAGITVNCVRVPNVKVDLSRYPALSPFMKWLYSVKSTFSITPEAMAETYRYLACSPEAGAFTGKYVDEKSRQVASSAYSMDAAEQERLMETTERFIRAPKKGQ